VDPKFQIPNQTHTSYSWKRSSIHNTWWNIIRIRYRRILTLSF